jgi:hypothetical protein
MNQISHIGNIFHFETARKATQGNAWARWSLCAFLMAAAAVGAPRRSGDATGQVAVVVGQSAPELERWAAEQLCTRLQKLFGIRTQPVVDVPAAARAIFMVGSPATNRAITRDSFPSVSRQGIVLRRLSLKNRPAFIVGGGSPAATLWAVSELGERWGVRYQLQGDVWPTRTQPFHMPDMNVALEPRLPIRGWRVINDFACGPESWGMADYRPLIDQLAKLKFNRLFLAIYPWQPFLDLKVRGIQRRWATLWYDFHYPITADIIGRGLFGAGPEFWNPDLPRNAGYPEFAAAGEKLVHSLMAYAHQRGMECMINATLTEFPPEFAPLLSGSKKVHQLGELDIVSGPNVRIEDPALNELAGAVLRATANTYPETDLVALGMPEHREWVGQYEEAWKGLDARYGIGKIRTLAEVLTAAQNRADYPGGAARAVQEVKGDLASLYFYDRLLNQLQVFKGTRRPDMRLIYDAVAEELYPLLGRILPHGAETMNFVDYTPARIVKRRQVLRNIPGREIPATLIYTLHDDNIGLLPQLMTGSLAVLTQDLEKYGWAGFVTRYWLTSDHDPTVAYLARAAWDATATPDAVNRDQMRAVCGQACVEEMMAAFHEVEQVTVELEWHGLGFAFPVPGMMMKHWKPGPAPVEIPGYRRGYQSALDHARRAAAGAEPEGRSYIDYWIGRLEFGIGYLDAVDAVYQAAAAEAEGDRNEAIRKTELAENAARVAVEAYARVARNQSDRGAIATLNEYVNRPLRAKLESLKSSQH